jgi:hypothetical protein
MKTQVECLTCGLKNKASDHHCIRCYAPLSGLEVLTLPDEGPARAGIPLWIKLTAGGAVLIVLLVVVSAVTLFWAVKQNVTRRNARLESAIRSSPKFAVPVMVDAGRYTFYDQDNGGGPEQEATPAAYALAQVGLLYVHTGFYSDISPTSNNQGRMVIDPNAGLIPRPYHHVSLELLEKGRAAAPNWVPYETKAGNKLGWKVPIGEREFGRIVEMVSGPEGTTSDTVMVSFTWKWKPTELGQSFDKASASYLAPATPKGYLRGQFDIDVNDSRATYWGTADLHRTGDTWQLDNLIWHGPSGVKLSRGAAEVERIMREGQ